VLALWDKLHEISQGIGVDVPNDNRILFQAPHKLEANDLEQLNAFVRKVDFFLDASVGERYWNLQINRHMVDLAVRHYKRKLVAVAL